MRPVKLDVGMHTHDLTTIPAYARKVEALGYDCLWSAETQHDPFLPLGVAATVTSSIKLGTSIAVAFPRSPMILAHIAWDLAKASATLAKIGKIARNFQGRMVIRAKYGNTEDNSYEAQMSRVIALKQHLVDKRWQPEDMIKAQLVPGPVTESGEGARSVASETPRKLEFVFTRAR